MPTRSVSGGIQLIGVSVRCVRCVPWFATVRRESGGPPPRRGSEEKRSRFLKLFSVWRGGDPATAGCDEGEDIGETGACQGGLTPILHFPHFPTIASFPSPSARRFSAPRRAGFPHRPRAEVRRPKRPPFRPALHSIPPCVIFAVYPLRKMRNASKSRTVELKSRAGKTRDRITGGDGSWQVREGRSATGVGERGSAGSALPRGAGTETAGSRPYPFTRGS